MIELWPLLLPVAAYSGWWISRRTHRFNIKQQTCALSREYVVGLNYFLNEQPDKAVDLFIKLLDIDSDTVETHMALGSLFRRRGEVDRAIRIHQNLVARTELSVLERQEALIALGQDYMSAGVFDRAEDIFLEVIRTSTTKEVRALQGLLAIYQQEKSWEKALEVLKKLECVTDHAMLIPMGHYYCEMAQDLIKTGAYEQARLMLQQALQIDKSSVRSSMMLAQLDMKAGRFKQAIRMLRQVPEQDHAFLSEMIEPLLQCYRELEAYDECIDYLQNLLESYPRSSVIFAIGEYLKQEKSEDLAIDFVSSALSRYPSIRGLNRLIYWHLESVHGKVRDKLQMLYGITSKFLENKPIYRCVHCGFSGKLLHWNCPSCKQWGKIKPIHGLEGN